MVGKKSKHVFFLWWFGMNLHLCFFLLCSSAENTSFRRGLRDINSLESTSTHSGIKLNLKNLQQVVVDNGIVSVNLSRPEGYVLGISYNGIDNILEAKNEGQDRGYFDVSWNDPGEPSKFQSHGNLIDPTSSYFDAIWNDPGEPNKFQRIKGTNFSVIAAEVDLVEVSFLKTWTSSMRGSSVPINIDIRYIFRSGDSGFYSYAIFNRPEGLPAVEVDQVRFVYKLNKDRFNFMAVSDDRQRMMPSMRDRETGQILAYPEAVILTHPTNSEFKGEVDDKYQYSCENTENSVHGWVSVDSISPVGFWMITPSNEFRNAGPIKQDLTSHVGPVTLSMFVSLHYAGKEVTMAFEEGETYNKVFGPVFVYLNSGSTSTKIVTQSLWSDAEQQGYQFWTRSDTKGNFVINNVVPGDYNLYAWVPGFIGDYKYDATITIKPGGIIKLNSLVYNPPRNGPTIWEIGVPDRSAAEFYVPEPLPTLRNKLYNKLPRDKFRQYGLWERYADLYPSDDLVYSVSDNKYNKDWFFAQVTRKTGNKTYKPTTWQIIFEQSNILSGKYTLQLALASATDAHLEVRFNDPSASPPHFTTGHIGGDNAIARHGIHGLHWLFSIDLPSSLLIKGKNTIYLRQSRATNSFQGVMYDYIRLEQPPTPNT